MSIRGEISAHFALCSIRPLWTITNRGLDPYFDPNTGQNGELLSGYTQAWSVPLGEYSLSNDPNFNPNIGSNQT